jgi:hypothetical protein
LPFPLVIIVLAASAAMVVFNFMLIRPGRRKEVQIMVGDG